MNETDRAVMLHRQGRFGEAEAAYRAGLVTLPNHPELNYGLGLLCARNGRIEEADYRFEQVLATHPDHAGALRSLGDVLAAGGRQHEAVLLFQRLIALQPGNAAAHFAIGQVHKQLGQFRQAQSALEKAVALDPDNPGYHYTLAETGPFRPGDSRLAELERLAGVEVRFSAQQQAELHFALFKAYDELERPAEAFAHLAKANRLFRALVPYNERDVFNLFREIQDIYTAETIGRFAGAGHPSEIPVFVVGMPRSGTTLVEQILASHPDVHGAGEIQYVQDLILGAHAGADYPADLAQLGQQGLRRFGGYYAVRLAALAPDKKRIVNKLPANSTHLGLLHLALPNARFIHLRRDRRDTCFSCYTKLFANGLNFAYDLGELGRYHKAADVLSAHWFDVLPANRLIEVQYETLVANFERESRRLVEFCGLGWDERCLKFYETKRGVRTMSEYQVRRPLFTTSIGRWRSYERWLGPLLEALA